MPLSLRSHSNSLDKIALDDRLTDNTTTKVVSSLTMQANKDIEINQSQETKTHGPRETGQCTLLSLRQ